MPDTTTAVSTHSHAALSFLPISSPWCFSYYFIFHAILTFENFRTYRPTLCYNFLYLAMISAKTGIIPPTNNEKVIPTTATEKRPLPPYYHPENHHPHLQSLQYATISRTNVHCSNISNILIVVSVSNYISFHG